MIFWMIYTWQQPVALILFINFYIKGYYWDAKIVGWCFDEAPVLSRDAPSGIREKRSFFSTKLSSSKWTWEWYSKAFLETNDLYNIYLTKKVEINPDHQKLMFSSTKMQLVAHIIYSRIDLWIPRITRFSLVVLQ